MRNQMTVKWEGSGVISTLPNDQPRKRLMDQNLVRQRPARRFYIYAFLRKDGTPYYIGKGTGRRINQPCGRTFELPPKDQRKVLIDGLTEPEAFEYEIALIHCLGRKDQGTGCLRNFTDGGDGVSGRVVSPEARAKISAAQKGRNRSPETRAKLSAANKGRKHSPEHRAKMSAALAGRTYSAEHRAKISASTTGKVRSAEHCSNISAALAGRAQSKESNAKRAAALTGRVHSKETNAKRAASKLRFTAAKYNVPYEQWASLSTKQRATIGQRYYVGKRGGALLEGFVDTSYSSTTSIN